MTTRNIHIALLEDDSAPVSPILGNDDGLHCSSCRREENVDDHECNVCSRNWAGTRCLIHTGWTPKPDAA